MFRILDQNKNLVGLLSNYSDYTITKKLEMDDRTLSLTTTANEVIQNGIVLEGYIETDENQYVIRDLKNGSDGQVQITAPLNVEDLEGTPYEKFQALDQNVYNVLALAFLPIIAWDVNTDGLSSGWENKTRSVYLTNTNAYEVLKKVLQGFRYECKIDARQKLVYLYDTVGEDRGAYFSNELNLKALEATSNTYEFYTELEAYGKDGLTFADINGGKNYVEDHTYSSKKKRFIWRDDRYTIKEHLLIDARDKLADMARPRISYSVEIVDLAKLSSAYTMLDFGVGDYVTIIDSVTKTKTKRRISEIEEHPDNPENNRCVIADKPLSYQDLIADIYDTINTVNSITTSTGGVRGDSVEDLTSSQISDLSDSVDLLTSEAIGTAGSHTSDALTSSMNDALGSYNNFQVSQIGNFETVVANRITSQLGQYQFLETQILNFGSAVGREIRAALAEFDSLAADYANINNAFINVLRANEASIGTLVADDISAALANFHIVTADIGDFDQVLADTITARLGEFKELNVDTITAQLGQYNQLFTDRIDAVEGNINSLKTNDLAAATGRIYNLEVDNANVKSLLAGNVGTGQLTSIVINGQNTTFDSSFIKQLVSQNISVNDLLAGKISTTKFVVGSDSGNFKIEDNTLLIKDSNSNPRIQVGLDGSGNYSFIVYDANGTGQLFNANGITESGIADGLIKDAKVADNANISASKLNIQSLFSAMDGSGYRLKSSTIFLDEQNQSLDVAFTGMSGRVTTVEGTAAEAASAAATAESNSSTAIQTANRALEVLNGISTLDALGMSLSNDAHVVHTNFDWTGGDWSDCSTKVSIWLGDTNVTPNSVIFVYPSSNVTGTWIANTATYKVTAMTGTDGYVDFDALYGTENRYMATRSGKVLLSRSGKAYTVPSGGSHIAKRFSISKAPDGKVGISYNLVSSTQAVTRDVVSETPSFTPSTIKFSVSQNDNGTVTSVLGIFVIEETNDYEVFTEKYRSVSPEAFKVYTPSSNSSLKGIRCSAYDSNGQLLDTETIVVLADADGLKGEVDLLAEDFDDIVNGDLKDAKEAIIEHTNHIGTLQTSVNGMSQQIIDTNTTLSAVVGANLAYQVTWIKNNNATTTLTAHVYRVEPDTKVYTEVTDEFPDGFFTWSVHGDSEVLVDDEYTGIQIGYGKEITIPNTLPGIDGIVDGWFIPSYVLAGLLTRSGKLLTSRSGKAYTIYKNIAE